MPLPGYLSTATITFGPYYDLAGNPTFVGMQGKLTLSQPMIDSIGGGTINPTVTFTIASDGTATVGPVIANDDPAVNQGTQYTVTWQALSYKPTPGNKTFQVLRASGSTVDFDILGPAPTSTGGTVTLPQVTSVAGRSGAVTLAKADVGLGNVDNTADAAKPVSTAQAAALGLSVAATVSASATLAAGKFTPVDATAAARTMTLPTDAGDGVTIGVEKVDASVNAVSVTGNIRGVPATTITLPWAHETLLLRADSAGSWWPVAGHKTKATLDAAYGTRTHVVVDPAGRGNYTTLAAALAAFPSGNVDIELVAGSHTHAALVSPVGVTNVTIRGQSRDATVVHCAAGFIDATGNCDQWTISDLFIQHDAGTNTDNGIRVDYPRRWRVRNCRVEGFGGDSIWYRGGIHAWIEGNIISAVDSTLTNGHAGIHVDRSVALVVPTTVITRNNYIVAGLQYGLLMERGNVGCMSEGDIAEGCAVGMRWDTSSATVIAPYTEANTVGIQLFDSAVTIIGRLRDEPVVTWTNVAAADRVITRVDRYFVNPGKGFIFGGSTGGSDPNTSVSERFGTGSPEGVVTAIPGSTYRRTNGAVGTTLYVKESGTGSTGWTALAGASVPGTPTAAAGSANGTTPPAPSVVAGSTDLAGEISFGSGTTPAVGSQVDVTFSAAMAAAPNVTVSSGNSGTPSRQPYVTNRSTTGFSIGFATAASASQSVGTYRVEYSVRT